MKIVDDYVAKLALDKCTRYEFTSKTKSPMIIYVVEASGPSEKNVMCYGHLDKQPWMLPWSEGLDPCKPVIRGDYLYGRGSSDDGYSVFSCMLAIKNL